MKTIILLLGNSWKVILIVVFMCNMTLCIKVNMLWMLFLQKTENKFIVGGSTMRLNATSKEKDDKMYCIASCHVTVWSRVLKFGCRNEQKHKCL